MIFKRKHINKIQSRQKSIAGGEKTGQQNNDETSHHQHNSKTRKEMTHSGIIDFHIKPRFNFYSRLMILMLINFMLLNDAECHNIIYYLSNNKNNIGIIQQKQDQIQSTSYFAYGNAKSHLTSQASLSFTYNEEYQDPISEMVYLRSRYYNPSTQSFITQDNHINQWNRYNFSDDNPIQNIDPTGHSAWDSFALSSAILATFAMPFTKGASSIIAFGIGGSIGSITQAIGNFIHHKNIAASGDLLIAASAWVGMVSAQPHLFIAEQEGEESGIISSANKDLWVTRSAMASTLISASGANLLKYQQNYGNNLSWNLTRYIALGALFGAIGGYFYGRLSPRLDQNTPYLSAALRGGFRTFINTSVTTIAPILNDVIDAASQQGSYNKFKSSSYWSNNAINLSTSFFLGMASGVTQAYWLKNSTSSYASLPRMIYLNLKTPITGKIIAGKVKDYGNFNF
ncbi:RHS repeat-associated core domain-containing protein [Facilibium subflavum]|uniref:RHS repeat-associated core domain-containing protein n=1 Tax=Facilibium subflavum TaxID=2219058 RepID=UPI000E652890|nr:RHS repeat-associated core domain-containing protein [Facilibium subflavum]